jgi:transcriptional regulator with PAS, ATPase and Fis domain
MDEIQKTQTSSQRRIRSISGKSPAILSVLSMADKIAPTPVTVLIQGESGTGKELLARRIYGNSDRAQGPYVAVNCSALQESLLESELFGHEKGSFTGAVQQKVGLCEIANQGTLFLDEIGEMSLPIQAKLLRFLQEGEFYRIGGKYPIRVNVRVISATNRDLEQQVKDNRFREDLFYRLNTITLKMPPLRQRKEDIPDLVQYFLENSRTEASPLPAKTISAEVMERFIQYRWPGNIRELQNVIERLKILSDNQTIQVHDLPPPFQSNLAQVEPNDSLLNIPIDMPLEAVEKRHILRTLAYNQGNKTKTAQSLGITIKTLYNKLHRYGTLQNSNLTPHRPT